MNAPSTQCRLTVRGQGDVAAVTSVNPGGVVAGLTENATYVVVLESVGPCRLYIDDVELQKAPDGSFSWTAGFFAGRVSAVVVENTGDEHAFYLVVEPAEQKLATEQFAAMLGEIRGFDAKLLLGISAGALEFGSEGCAGRFDMLVQWTRLKQHGRNFLAAMAALSRTEHRFLRPAFQSISLAQVRHLPPLALLDRRLAALAIGETLDGDALESIRLRAHVPAATADTPANRALLSLLMRFRSTVLQLTDWAQSPSDRLSKEDHAARRPRRLHVLGEFSATVERLRSMRPFSEVAKAEITAAGLTQVAAHPLYSCAYRKGVEALRRGAEGENLHEHLQASPSWGVYETWCFVRLCAVLERAIGIVLRPSKPSVASADLAMSFAFPDGQKVELLFQPVFASESPFVDRHAWSLSKERRPDILLMLTQGSERRFIVFDAKYRSGRENVLDAMSSAHIYHDSLRIDASRPGLCLLLLPGRTDVSSLEVDSFFEEHKVGAVSNFNVSGVGLERCVNIVRQWLGVSHLAPSTGSTDVTNPLMHDSITVS
jgi:hypothetical protein